MRCGKESCLLRMQALDRDDCWIDGHVQIYRSNFLLWEAPLKLVGPPKLRHNIIVTTSFCTQSPNSTAQTFQEQEHFR